eukprot:TRINITY_DN4991_c0_g1_i1.p1 TRINITY_DN4991_c0_g1~~TRINITY_DN4991_c0_g1_i1.p1  ORF type:complete len:61 (+),score=1.95 TRINITY_DN4991_c0_g1_i1:293-475(+)
MKKTPAFYMGARFNQPKRSTYTPGPAAYGPPICERIQHTPKGRLRGGGKKLMLTSIRIKP